MGFPDWTKKTPLTKGVNITITEHGWVHWYSLSATSGEYRWITVNGETISKAADDGCDTYNSEDSCFVPVQPGDIVYASGYYNTFDFYPYK